MIEKIAVKNFKSVVDLELELGQLNIFIGENGCGKTNILEAIAFGSAGFNPSVGPRIYGDSLANIRGVRVTDASNMFARFETNFSEEIVVSFQFNESEIMQVQANSLNENEWLALVGRPEQLKRFNDKLNESQKEEELSLEKFYKLLAEDDEFREIISGFYMSGLHQSSAQIRNLSNFVIFCPENYFLRRFEEEGQLRPLGIRGEGLFKHLVSLYKKDPEILVRIGEKLRLIGWFEGFEIPKDLMFTEKRINIKDKYLKELDFFDQRSANEGFLYLLFYFTLFLSPDTPGFFAIDNIDNALNPKLGAELLRQLTAICKENGKQVILTTHNPAILDGLDLEDDTQRLFTVYRNADGHTTIKRVKTPKKINGKEPVRLSEAFIRGYLGGLPKNF